MTEAEWLACTDAGSMLRFLRARELMLRRRPGRVMRLFACACCRRIWDLLTDNRSRLAVEVAERHADGRASKRELAEAAQGANDAYCDFLSEVAVLSSGPRASQQGVVCSLRDAAKAEVEAARPNPAYIVADSF